jgi:rhamnose transport system permease protein
VAAPPGPDRRPLLRRLLRWETALVLLLLAVGLVGEQTSPGFLTGTNLFYVGLDVSEIALMALPLTMIIIAGEIDLSIASILGLTSALLGWLWNSGWPLELIFPTVLVAGALAGALNGFLVTRLGLPSLAVTIGTLALYRGLAFVILGDQAVADFPASYTRYGTTPIPGTQVPYPMALFAVLAVVFAVVLHATPFGRSVFAIGANQEAAFFSGIRVRRTKFILYVLSGAMSGLAGIVYTLRFASARADNGAGLELAVVAAVLLGGVSIFGGKGTLGGVVAAVFLLGGIRSALILNDVSNDILNVVTGLLLIGSVIAPNASAAIGQAVSRRRAASATPAEPAGAG